MRLRKEASIDGKLDISVLWEPPVVSLGGRHKAEQFSQIDVVVAALVQHRVDVSLDLSEDSAVRNVLQLGLLLWLHGSRRLELSQILLHVKQGLQIAQRVVHLSLAAGSSNARLATVHVTTRSN